MIKQPERSEKEKELLTAMFQAYDALRCLGWREASYCPCRSTAEDPAVWDYIEAGSTGIHRGFRDRGGAFWLMDNMGMSPSKPILFRAVLP